MVPPRITFVDDLLCDEMFVARRWPHLYRDDEPSPEQQERERQARRDMERSSGLVARPHYVRDARRSA